MSTLCFFLLLCLLFSAPVIIWWLQDRKYDALCARQEEEHDRWQATMQNTNTIRLYLNNDLKGEFTSLSEARRFLEQCDLEDQYDKSKD